MHFPTSRIFKLLANIYCFFQRYARFSLLFCAENAVKSPTNYLINCCAVPAGYPRVIENPTLKSVEKDRNTVMICSAAGDPEPSVVWYKDYVPVDMSDPRIKLLPTGK